MEVTAVYKYRSEPFITIETTQVWVVDKPAYTEYVYGEKCSGCGATK